MTTAASPAPSRTRYLCPASATPPSASRLADSPAPGPDDLEPIWRADGTPVTNTETGTGVVLLEAEVTLWYLPGHGLLGAGTPTQGLTTIMSAACRPARLQQAARPRRHRVRDDRGVPPAAGRDGSGAELRRGTSAQPSTRCGRVHSGWWWWRAATGPAPRPSGDERPLVTRVAWTDAAWRPTGGGCLSDARRAAGRPSGPASRSTRYGCERQARGVETPSAMSAGST